MWTVPEPGRPSVVQRTIPLLYSPLCLSHLHRLPLIIRSLCLYSPPRVNDDKRSERREAIWRRERRGFRKMVGPRPRWKFQGYSRAGLPAQDRLEHNTDVVRPACERVESTENRVFRLRTRMRQLRKGQPIVHVQRTSCNVISLRP